jgi:surface protein
MGTSVQYGALFLEENAHADLYSCDFESPWTLWMHPSAVAHVYCTYPAGLNAAYEQGESAGTLVDYSGQGCPGDATVVAMDDGTIRTAVAAWLADATAAEATYGHISTWKTGEVTDMAGLFEDASSFNDDISPWDTSGVTTMNGMFSKTSSFNQPIGAWDTSGVRRMDWMFVGSAFNQPIGD